MLSAMTTLFGSATPCKRAARFGVSPRCSQVRTARPTKQHGSTIITHSPIHLLDQWSDEVGTLGSSSPSIIPSVILWRLKPKTPFWQAAEKC